MSSRLPLTPDQVIDVRIAREALAASLADPAPENYGQHLAKLENHLQAVLQLVGELSGSTPTMPEADAGEEPLISREEMPPGPAYGDTDAERIRELIETGRSVRVTGRPIVEPIIEALGGLDGDIKPGGRAAP